ncbi:MAG: hypothetical protein LBT65_02685 [Synergistaceae bacterium]|jgi:uncharacterized ion transporter superfamily protein YfcC|nr:hypothetical protein [Synergistaceae bacterium]
MLFDLPPIAGLLPLLLYIVLSFRKNMHPIVNVLVCTIVGAVLVKQPLLEMGGVLAKSLGSFLALVGFIIMLGSALGVVLKKTGVAENIVNILMRKIGVNTQSRAILATMACSVTLVTLLGTLAGANAVIAPIVIPLVAAIGITPSALAAIFQGAGQAGLFIGPFTPPMVTLMEITGLSYPQVLFTAGLPVAILMWIITFFMARRIQKSTMGLYSYSGDVGLPPETYQPSPKTVRATWTFLGVLALLVVYGIFRKGGASYAIVVMLGTGIFTGLAGGLSLGEICDGMMEGCGRLVWLFVLFVFFDPFLAFVEKSGAFNALVDYLSPYIATAGKTGFALFSALVGIFGINGAAVAQAVMIDKLFRGFLDPFGISMYLWAMIVLVGSQITSFAYPGGDMIGQMGLAQSKDVTSMLKLGYVIIVATLVMAVLVSSIF